MSKLISSYATRRSRAACSPIKPTTEEIQERHLKHMALITENLARPLSEDLTYEQQQWLYFRMGRPFPKPYAPWPKTKKKFEFKTFSFAEVLASVEPLEETDY